VRRSRHHALPALFVAALTAVATATGMLGAGVAGATAAPAASAISTAPAASGLEHRTAPSSAPLPTQRGSEATTATAGAEQVELALAPRDEAGLRALAQDAAKLAPAVRAARRRQVLPDAATVQEVTSRVQQLGLDVVAANTSTVTVRGSATSIRQLFGSARNSYSTLPSAQALPALPASLRGLVTVAAGGDETRAAFLPRDTPAGAAPLTQADLRAAYGVADSGSAVPTAGSPAIATIQFSGWNPADLTSYAQSNNLYGGTSYDPVASGGYTAVDVDGGATFSADGQVEVALDQESIATIAPSLNQIAYFAPNTDALAFSDALNQIASDAASKHIIAVSDSWGRCEPYRYPDFAIDRQDPTLTADEDAVMSAISAGLTIFAASGDSGSNDCDVNPNSPNASSVNPAVDSPASLPYVTGVGGTTVQPGQATTSWATDDLDSSGGGYSAVYCATASQVAVLPKNSQSSDPKNCLTTGRIRGVPDIALDANPATGLEITSAGCEGSGPNPNSCLVGGTSLAAPLAAAGFATTIVQDGALAGIGDINPALDGARGTSGLQDVTAGGSNGLYSPTVGWDPITGLGSPDWTALAPRLLGTTVANSLFAVHATGTSSGHVEIDELTQASGYKTYHREVATALAPTDPANWQYFIAPFRGDGKHDLYAIRTGNTGSGMVEVHVLSEASNYQTYIDHIATPLPEVAPNQWQFTLGSFAGDKASDLYAIHYNATSSHRVEVHTLSAASNYRTWVEHAATALAVVAPNTWQFLVGDATGSGNLVGVLRSGGSRHTEVHILTRVSGYRTFSLHVATPLPPMPVSIAEFNLTTYDADATPDLNLTLFANTGSGDTEVHVLNGATSFTRWDQQIATSLGTVDPASWSFQLAH
jgi:kumamolisin